MAETEVHEFTLPLPPSANKLTSHAYGRRATFRHPVYQKWINDCNLLTRVKQKRTHHSWDVDIKFYIYYVHKFTKLDTDNCLKPIVDFCKNLIGIDDRYNLRWSGQRMNIQAPKQRKDHYCEIKLTLY